MIHHQHFYAYCVQAINLFLYCLHNYCYYQVYGIIKNVRSTEFQLLYTWRLFYTYHTLFKETGLNWLP